MSSIKLKLTSTINHFRVKRLLFYKNIHLFWIKKYMYRYEKLIFVFPLKLLAKISTKKKNKNLNCYVSYDYHF